MGGRVHYFRPLGVLLLRVPSVVDVEGSHAGRRGYRVVVSVLSHGEQVHPVVLLLVDVWPEVCFDILVDSFGLSISLWVEGHGHSGAHSCDGQEILPGVEREPGIMVGHDVSR